MINTLAIHAAAVVDYAVGGFAQLMVKPFISGVKALFQLRFVNRPSDG